MSSLESVSRLLKNYDAKHLYELSSLDEGLRLKALSTVSQGILGLRSAKFDIVERVKRRKVGAQYSFAHLAQEPNHDNGINQSLTDMFCVNFDLNKIRGEVDKAYHKSTGNYFGRLRKEMNLDPAIKEDGTIDITKVDFSVYGQDEAVKRAAFLASYTVSEAARKRIKKQKETLGISKGKIVKEKPIVINTVLTIDPSQSKSPKGITTWVSKPDFFTKLYAGSSVLVINSSSSTERYRDYCNESYGISGLFNRVYDGAGEKPSKNSYNDFIKRIKDMLKAGMTFTEIENSLLQESLFTNRFNRFPDLAFVSHAFKKLLQREPTPDEIKTIIEKTNPLYLNDAIIVNTIVTTNEYIKLLAKKLYHELLGRDPDIGETNTFVEHFRAGKNIGKIASEIKVGSEFVKVGRKESNMIHFGEAVSLKTKGLKERLRNTLRHGLQTVQVQTNRIINIFKRAA